MAAAAEYLANSLEDPFVVVVSDFESCSPYTRRSFVVSQILLITFFLIVSYSHRGDDVGERRSGGEMSGVGEGRAAKRKTNYTYHVSC